MSLIPALAFFNEVNKSLQRAIFLAENFVSILSQVSDLLIERTTLRIQHREIRRRQRALCYKLLEIIDEVCGFIEVCRPERIGLICEEIQKCMDEGRTQLDINDKELLLKCFPETCDFFEEINKRLQIVTELQKGFMDRNDSLIAHTKELCTKAENVQYWYRRVGNIATIAAVSCIALGQWFGCINLGMIIGGTVLVLGTVLKFEEKDYKAAIKKFENIDKDGDKLQKVAEEIEDLMRCQRIQTQLSNFERLRPLLTTVKTSIENINEILHDPGRNFSHQRRKVTEIIRSIKEESD
jgi:hypothetical protein